MNTVKRKALAAAGAFALLYGGGVQADLLQYSFTGADGTQHTLEPNATYANPTGNMTFALSAGVDRKVRMSILDSAGKVLSSETSELLGANDRITVGGNQYYGAFLNLPAPKQGSYELKAEILASDGSSVKVDSHEMIVDTTPPSASPMTATNSGYGQVTSGSVWKLGRGGSADTFFRVTDVTDASPIAEATVSLYRGDGSLHFERKANYDVPTQRVDVRNDAGFFPSSNLDENFEVQIQIKDRAGNVWKSQRQTVRWDSETDSPSAPFGVYDPESNNVLGPGLKGFVPYKAGMEVKTNPIRLAYRVPKNNWHEYAEGGISLVNGLGEKSVVGTDSKYVYIIWSGPYGNTNNNSTRWSNFGQWGGGSILYNLKLSDSAPKTPVLKSVEYHFSDVGWHSFYRQPINNSLLPLSFDQIRVTAEKRPFDQIASHRGSCTIPAGQTSCIINAGYTMEPGTTGYIHNVAIVRNKENTLRSSNRYAEVNWNDQHYPSLSYDYDEAAKELTVYVTQPSRGSYFDRLRLRSAWLEDGDGNQLSPKGGKVEENKENYTFKWDLKTLPEGNFNLYAVAQEQHGPKTKIPLFPMTSDRTPPQLDIQITGGDQISTLDQFLISVTDTYDTEPEITDIRLEGGPAKDRVQLSWRKASSGLFRLEYPIMFPSLKAGEGYTLTVTAMDAQENATTKDFQFRYEPRQISLADGMDGKLMIPAVAQEFQRLDGGHVIQTEPITLSGDTVVSGTYDVFATLRSDAEVPLVVNGVVIRPGETMSVMSQHNFASSGGRINLPLRPAEGGIDGTSNLLVMTSAPNSPVLVLNVNTWTGKAKLSAENWEVRQVIDPVSITASPETGVACRLTSDEEAARSTDPIRDPVCLIEWDETPDETEQVSAEAQGLKITALKGQAVALGEQPVSYSMYLFSGDGRKVRVGGGHETLKVTSAFGSVGYKPMNDLNEVYRVIQEFDVRMKQSKGPSCSLTLDPARAKNSAESRRVGDASKTCLFEWVEVPDGIQQDPLSNTPYLFGTLREKTAHKLRWRVSIFSRNGTRVTLATESHAIDAIDPPAPDISVWSSYHYQDDLYMVPKEGGHIGDAIFDAEPSPLDIKVQRGEEELTNETFQPGRGMFSQIYRRLNTEPANLWDETSFRFDAAYNPLPEISSEKTIRAIAVPGDNIAPRMDVGDVREALDNAPLSVSVNITDLMNPGMEYDPEEMGEWEIRLGREERYNEITPMTEFTDAPDGNVSFDLDLTGVDRLVRLIAEARLKSPIEGYERIEKSQRLYMTVLRGGAIDADIEARRLSGPAPFTTVLQVGLEDLLDRAATGDVVWEVSADGGKSWESETRTDRNRMRWYNTFEKGEHLVRAKIINSNSGIESYTETVEVIAYDQVTVEVEGAETMFVGTSETYSVKAVGPNGEPMEDAVVKWTEDRGKSFFHVGDSYTVSSDEPKRFRFEAWVRDASAPDDDRYAYTRARVSASFQPIRGPKVYLRGPKVIEVGKEYQYEAQLAPPHRGMEIDMDGYFVLPNGEQASGQTLTYAPTEQDLETGRIKLNYVAWVEGFKDAGTEASRELYARVWKYVWPKFTLYTRTSAMVAPVEVSAYARALSFRGKLDNPVYTWEIPEGDGVEVTDKRWDDLRKLVITEPGTYTLKATITDARGNDAVVERTLEVGEADPYEVGISFSASNSHNRAPLGLYLRPSVQGGHPRDQVTDYTYSVNGEPIETRGIVARLELPEGQHDVGLTIKTLMGEEITETKTFNVVPNVPPTCEVEVTDSSSSWMLRATCEDVDGDMQSYQWKVNGNELAARSYRLRLYKSSYDDIMPMIEVVGIDDAGDASDPIIVQ